jgi:hypothetical protein
VAGKDVARPLWTRTKHDPKGEQSSARRE